MKPKITPEEYKKILESLELNTLYLTELTSKYKEDFVTSSLSIDIDEKYTYEQKNGLLKVIYVYKLSAKDASKEDSAIFLQAKYTVLYNITKDVVITKDFMKIFSDLTLGMLLWTYFRELVNNIIYRMGLPSLVLPLKVR